MTIAKRVKFHEARRAFYDGADVLVSEHGHEPTRTVSVSTTTHNNRSTSWTDLVEQVRMWRNRYPNQRFYVLADEVGT